MDGWVNEWKEQIRYTVLAQPSLNFPQVGGGKFISPTEILATFQLQI
jgi:hypothetical protein